MTDVKGEFQEAATRKIDVDIRPEMEKTKETPHEQILPDFINEPGRLPLSVSVEIQGGMLLNIARIGDVLPVKCTREFSVGTDVITDAAINIYAGERALASSNKQIGTAVVPRIERLSNGKAIITISFEIERDCTIVIDAIDEGSLKKVKKIIEPSWIPSNKEILEMVNDARDNLIKDEETRLNSSIVFKARDIIFRTDIILRKKRRELSREKKKAIISKQNELRKLIKKLDVENMSKEKRKEINIAIAALDQITSK